MKSINLQNITRVVIIDDFIGIHNIWRDKLRNYKNIDIISFFSKKEAQKYIQDFRNELKNSFFFVDYLLKTILENGISFITKNNLQNQVILVTSKYLESFVKNKSVINSSD